LVDVHHHGPLEVGDGAGYGVETVIVCKRPAIFGMGDARLIVNRD
jgi:hypothetical protein